MTWDTIALVCLGWAACGWLALLYACKRERFTPPLVPGLIVGSFAGLLGMLMWVIILAFEYE